MIDVFGTLNGVLAADADALDAAAQHPATAAHMQLLATVVRHLLQADLRRGPIVANSKQLTDYLNVTAAHAQVEQFRVLFLNARHELIRDDLMAQGTTTEAAVYTRNIIKRALDLGAVGLILVHNHPSGDATASRADIEITRTLDRASCLLGLRLIDHIIVGRGAWLSLRSEQLI